MNKANVSELKKLLNFSKKKYNYKIKNIIKRAKNIPTKTQKLLKFHKEIFNYIFKSLSTEILSCRIFINPFSWRIFIF